MNYLNSILLIILILAVILSTWQIEKAIREVGFALCLVERFKAEDASIRESSKETIAVKICTPELLGRFSPKIFKDWLTTKPTFKRLGKKEAQPIAEQGSEQK